MCLKIASVGDIMLGENLHHHRRGVASRYLGHFQDLLGSEVFSVINDSELFFGNFECSLLPDAEWKSAGLERSMYAAPESSTDFFKDWNPDIILNVANNHFGQHGSAASDYTVDCLEKRGISCIGRNCHPLEIHAKERRLMAWGVTIVEDRYVDAGHFKSTSKDLIEDIGWVEKQPDDYWVVSIHWGNEYLTQPSDTQKRLASKLVEKGVDLILGHHPHVVQPVEQTEGGIIVYSHGNFIFDQNFSLLTQQGLLVEIEVSNEGIEVYKTEQRKFAVIHAEQWNPSCLQNFCERKNKRYRPLLMRILMKLELGFHFYEVPGEIWRYFLNRMINRLHR